MKKGREQDACPSLTPAQPRREGWQRPAVPCRCPEGNYRKYSGTSSTSSPLNLSGPPRRHCMYEFAARSNRSAALRYSNVCDILCIMARRQKPSHSLHQVGKADRRDFGMRIGAISTHPHSEALVSLPRTPQIREAATCRRVA